MAAVRVVQSGVYWAVAMAVPLVVHWVEDWAGSKAKYWAAQSVDR